VFKSHYTLLHWKVNYMAIIRSCVNLFAFLICTGISEFGKMRDKELIRAYTSFGMSTELMPKNATQVTNLVQVYFILLCLFRPPLWSSGQSSWLRIQRSGFDSELYQILWEVVDLERGPLSLVSTIEELLGRNNSGSSLESRVHGHWDPSRWPHDVFYPKMLALTSPTSGSFFVGVVRSQTKTT
jgi:hypothetical protein